MVKQALLDTDTISYFFRKEPKVVSKVDDYLQVFGYVNVSVVTYYEVLNGLYFKDAKRQLKQFQSFIALNQVIPLTEACAELAARTYATLRATGISIGHNDIMIASTAMTYDFRLVSNNVKHFQQIDGLDVDNWAV